MSDDKKTVVQVEVKEENAKKNPNNLRTALILFSVVAVFFIGVIVKQTFLLGK